MHRGWLRVSFLVLTLAGCGDDDEPNDDAQDDGGLFDGGDGGRDGGVDGGLDGGGRLDGSTDSGASTMDSAASDASRADTGAGQSDASGDSGLSDAGDMDASGDDGGGDAEDAGELDASEGDASTDDAAPDAPASETFTAIYAILAPCVGCHSGGTPQGGLSLADEATAYANLVDRAPSATGVCASSGLTLVVPGNPNASLLLQKLGDAPPCGLRMPQPASAAPLPTDQIDRIRAWIQQGASE